MRISAEAIFFAIDRELPEYALGERKAEHYNFIYTTPAQYFDMPTHILHAFYIKDIRFDYAPYISLAPAATPFKCPAPAYKSAASPKRFSRSYVSRRRHIIILRLLSRWTHVRITTYQQSLRCAISMLGTQ